MDLPQPFEITITPPPPPKPKSLIDWLVLVGLYAGVGVVLYVGVGVGWVGTLQHYKIKTL